MARKRNKSLVEDSPEPDADEHQHNPEQTLPPVSDDTPPGPDEPGNVSASTPASPQPAPEVETHSRGPLMGPLQRFEREIDSQMDRNDPVLCELANAKGTKHSVKWLQDYAKRRKVAMRVMGNGNLVEIAGKKFILVDPATNQVRQHRITFPKPSK